MSVKKSKKRPAAKSAPLKAHTLINRLEGEVESLLKRLVQQGEKSSREFKNNFDDLFNRLRKTSLYIKATAKGGDFEKEIRRLVEDVVSKVKKLKINQGGLNTKKLLEEARKNLDAFVSKIEKSNLVSRARVKAENTREEILSFLSIPSQTEVEKLERKIVHLEKRLHNLSQRAA